MRSLYNYNAISQYLTIESKKPERATRSGTEGKSACETPNDAQSAGVPEIYIYMQATNTASKLLRQMMINWQLRLKKTDYDKPDTA